MTKQDDVRRIRSALKAAGYERSPGKIERLWAAYSQIEYDGCPWVSPDAMSDGDIVGNILRMESWIDE